jgi:small subunit ribosomal protein S15
MAEEETKKNDWVKIKPAELEKIVVDLYKQGESTAKIGLVLRDKYGIPKAKLLGKRIAEILTNAKVALRSGKDIIQKKIDILNKHVEKNKHDQPAKKKLVKELWAIKGVD